MVWTRLNDSWTDQPQLEELDYAVRWHYLCLIQFCSRNSRFDGLIRSVDARRVSDHPNPAEANATLAEHGLITVEGTAYRLVNIDDHIPPPHVRNQTEQAKIRKRRERAHKAGDHSLCLPGKCITIPLDEEVTGDSHADVTRDDRTGQDRTGQAAIASDSPNVISWPTAVPGEPSRTA